MKSIVRKPWSTSALLERRGDARATIIGISMQIAAINKRANTLRRRRIRINRYIEVVTSNINRKSGA